MIAIFNETNNPWELKITNDKFSKISTSMDTYNNKKKFINVSLSHMNIDTDIEKYVDMGNTCKTIYDKPTTIKFKNKDLGPIVSSCEDPKYNTDVLFITIPLNKGVITEIGGEKAVILKHIIANGVLTMIASIRPVIAKHNRYMFNITISNSETGTDTKYAFDRVDGENRYTVSVIESESTNEEVNTLKIMNFRPMKPTHLVFVHNDDVNEFKAVCKNIDRHNVVYFNDELTLASGIENARAVHYRAATLFVSKADEKANPAIFDHMKSSFAAMNIMYGTGKVSVIK